MMRLNRWVGLLIISAMLGQLAQAQKEDLDANQKGFTAVAQSGKMLNLVLEPAGKQLKLFLTGKPAAEIKVEEAQVEVTYGLGQTRQKLAVRKVTDPATGKTSYLIDRIEHPMENVEISIRSGKASERFILPRID